MPPSAPTELDPAFLDLLIDGLLETVPAGSGSRDRRRETVRAMVLAMQPADAHEAMLAVQAVGAHYAALDSLKRAAQPEVEDKMALRLRINAAGMARMMQAALRALQARRKARQPVPEAPRARQARHAGWAAGMGAGAAVAPPSALRAAAAEDPAQARAAELRKRNWEDMTMEERRIAYGTPGPSAGPKTAP